MNKNEKHELDKPEQKLEKDSNESSKTKDDEEKEFQLNLSAINYFLFFVVFIIIFSINLTLWLMIGLNYK